MTKQNYPVNRHALLSTAAKLYCQGCRTLQVVTDFFAGVSEAQLACGHRRKLESGRETCSA